MSIDRTQLSKFLSLILRHKPDAIGLELDSQGWANIEQLIDKAHAAGTKFDRTELLHVVETSDKKRFSVSADGLRIRAAQGHSVSVELGLSPKSLRPCCFTGPRRDLWKQSFNRASSRKRASRSTSPSMKRRPVEWGRDMASHTSLKSTPLPCMRAASDSTSLTTASGRQTEYRRNSLCDRQPEQNRDRRVGRANGSSL
jgi:hypothetical protein